MSRREWLNAAGVAAVAASPALKIVRSTVLGGFELRQSAGRVAFLLKGEERWVIDASRFSGSPSLSATTHAGVVEVVLCHARIPGTDVPADFTCRISPALLGSRIELSLSFAGKMQGVFESWLDGLESLSCTMSVGDRTIFRGVDHLLVLHGETSAEFSPDWCLRLSAERAAVFTATEGEFAASGLTIRLPDDEEKSLLHHAPLRRGVVELESNADRWPLGVHFPGGWRIADRDRSFDHILLETTENGEGTRRGAMVFASKGADRLVRVVAPSGLFAHTGTAAELRFQDFHYARGIGGDGVSQAVIGRFAPSPVWVTDGRSSVALADGPSTRPFELVADRGVLTRISCVPEAHQILVPVPDAVSVPMKLNAPIPVDLGSELALNTPMGQSSIELSDEKQKAAPASQAKKVALPKTIASIINDNIGLQVIRPEDFLLLEFKFKNLHLEGEGSSMRLARSDSQGSAYIVVTLPPQHVNEQAFFETGKSTETQVEKDNKITYPGGDEPIQPLPAGAKLSGPSRLVFELPPNTSSVPYTLKDLLTACNGAVLVLSPGASVLTTAQEKANASVSSVANTRFASLSAAANVLAATPGVKRKGQTSIVHQELAGATFGADEVSAKKRMDALLYVLESDDTASPEVLDAYAAELARVAGYAAGESGQIVNPGLSSFKRTGVALLPQAPVEPTEFDTSIELPYHLYLAPNPACVWTHETEPKAANERVELWHTRLGYRGRFGQIIEKPHLLRTVRAIWSPDMHQQAGDVPLHYNSSTKNDAFRMTLDKRDRHEIVHLSANYAMGNVDGTGDYVPVPINVNHLMLSGLGGWINVRGDWKPPTVLSVETWEHRGTMGRDHYVRVVYAGYLFPFGHHASLVKITERKFQKVASGETYAVLKQRMFIVVREHEKTYPALGQPNDGRAFPFKRVTITTVSTPNLDKPEDDCIANAAQSMFWPHVAGAPFEFHMEGEDADGQISQFKAPLIFLDQSAAFNSNNYGTAKPSTGDKANAKKTICASYNSRAGNSPLAFHGQKLAFANSTAPGDTTFVTDSVILSCDLFSGDLTMLRGAKQPPFYPALWRANVRVAAIEQLAGADATCEISLHQPYIDSGFAPAQNIGQVFAGLTTKISVGFDGDTSRSGGLLTPNIDIGGLSRSLGAVGGDIQALTTGGFSAKSFLDGAKIFGAISLSDILADVTPSNFDPARIPQFRSERTADLIRTSYYWNPVIQGDPIGFFKPDQKYFTLQATVLAPLNGGSPNYEVTGSMGPFALVLVPKVLEVLQLDFASAQFSILNGQKPDVSVDFSGITFLNCLSFMNEVTRYVPLDGFKDPPELSVTTEGITASYTIGIPTIAVGMFSLQHVSFGAGFELPFTGAPLSTRLLFCERENPFTLTVAIFGGGGFLGLIATPKGIAVEAALEFGGSLALNLGVASGSVYAMAGIYYSNAGDEVTLAAYFRLGGAVEVLGLICISVEFYMELVYQTGGTLYGDASVKVKVEVMFFSKTVTLHTSKTFAGSPGDPSIKETLTLNEWQSYRAAFA